MRPLKIVRELIDHAEAMARLLRSSPDSWWPEMGEEDEVGLLRAAQHVLMRNGAPYMRAGYALREWLTATQQTAETLDACEQMWPALRERTHHWRSRLDMIRSELFLMRRASDVRRAAEVLFVSAGHPTLSAIVHAFESEETHVADGRGSGDVESVYPWFCLYRYRQALAAAARAAGSNVAFPAFHPEEHLAQLDDNAQAQLQAALRRYRSANLLFSWIRYGQNEGPADRYPSLFPPHHGNQYRRLREKMAFLQDLDQVRQVLKQSELPGDEIENALAVIGRLDEALREIDLPSLMQAVSSEGGQDGPQSMIGNQAPINVIPGGKKGACCPIVLALAVGRSKRSPAGWPGVMKRLKAHLIECSGVTRLAMIVTDTWDSAEFFEEHFAEFRAHYGKGVRFLFFAAGAVPMQLSPMWIDFNTLP